jgi:hypothetical protein
MKYIIFLTLLTSVLGTLWERDNCRILHFDMVGDAEFVICKNVTYWSNTKEVLHIHGKNITLNPFSPHKMWLNDTQKLVGMSTSDSYVFNSRLGDYEHNETLDMNYLMRKIIMSMRHPVEQTDGTFYKDTHEEEHEAIGEYSSEQDAYMMNHFLSHPFSHKSIVDVITDYVYESNTIPIETVDRATYRAAVEKIPDLQDIRLMLTCTWPNGTSISVDVWFGQDLSGNKEDVDIDCVINKLKSGSG